MRGSYYHYGLSTSKTRTQAVEQAVKEDAELKRAKLLNAGKNAENTELTGAKPESANTAGRPQG